MDQELQRLEEVPKAKILLKMYQIGKCQAMMAYMDSGLEYSLQSTTDWLSKWIDTYERLKYPNGWRKERPPGSKKIPKK